METSLSDHLERELCANLRLSCDKHGKETDLLKSSELFCELGRVYRCRSPDKVSLIQSAVLFNGVIRRNPANVAEIKKDLNELCFHVLGLAKAARRNENLTEIWFPYYQRLKRIRESVECALVKILPIPQCSDEEFQQLAASKVDTMEKLQRRITSDFVSIMRDIMGHCTEIMGTPPCRYALVGMGSLARQEVTPYSDFENIIVLQENVNSDNVIEYFRWVSVLFQLIIVNMGETIIAIMNFPYLNSYKDKKFNWFYDAYTPRGICFDGLVPYACKYPLGRIETLGRPWKTELIRPVSDMLEYLQADVDLKNGYHLGDMLTKVCYVAGDIDIYNTFEQGVIEYVSHEVVTHDYRPSRFTPILQKHPFHWQVNEDVRSFSPIINSETIIENAQLNIKRMIYRAATLSVAALGRFHKVHAASSFQQVRALCDGGFIDKSLEADLLFAVAVACETRVKIYSQYRSLRDVVQNSVDNQTSIVEKLMGSKGYVAYFEAVTRAQQTVLKDVCDNTIPQLENYGNFRVAMWHAIMRNFAKAVVEIEQTAKSGNHTDNAVTPEVYHLWAYCHYKLNQAKEALQYFTLAKVTAIANEYPFQFRVNCDLYIGKCMLLLNWQPQEVYQHFQTVLNDIETYRGNDSLDRVYAEAHLCLGKANFNVKDYARSGDHYKEAISMFRYLKLKRELAETEHCFGNSLLHQKKFRGALEHFQNELDARTDNGKDLNVIKCQAAIAQCKEGIDEVNLTERSAKQ